MLRPESLTILAAGRSAENEIAGVVDRTDFVGPSVRILVKTAFGVACVRSPREPGGVPPSVGAHVRLGWGSASAAVFGDSAPQGSDMFLAR